MRGDLRGLRPRALLFGRRRRVGPRRARRRGLGSPGLRVAALREARCLVLRGLDLSPEPVPWMRKPRQWTENNVSTDSTLWSQVFPIPCSRFEPPLPWVRGDLRLHARGRGLQALAGLGPGLQQRLQAHHVARGARLLRRRGLLLGREDLRRSPELSLLRLALSSTSCMRTKTLRSKSYGSILAL